VRDFKPREGESYPVGPLLFDPGERFFYGPSTHWVARLVAAISDQPFDAYFRERIFAPLQMPDTSYNVPPEKLERLAVIHQREVSGEITKLPTQQGAVVEPRGDGGLRSTADDYVRFMRMVLNDGTLDGARILSPESIAAMSRNQIGTLGVPAQKSAQPERSADFNFIADGRDKWGIGFLLTADSVPEKRSAGSLSWAGINNTYFWIDRNRGVAGVILMQLLPFADPNALAVYDVFERAVYRLSGSI
jgi:CubicO group peptidase (beta-lactamase class C family)